MKEFKTEDEAIEYAEDNIGKYDYEIVLVDGKYTMLSNTCLPIQEEIRNDIEAMVKKLLTKVIGWDGKTDHSENCIDDAINYVGARATETVIEVLEEYGVNIMSAYLDF